MKLEDNPIATTPKRSQVNLVVIYYFTIAAFVLVSIYPGNRIWGLNQWAFLSQLWYILFISVSVLLPSFFWLIMRKIGASAKLKVRSIFESSKVYFVLSVVLICAMGIFFYLLRAKMHFLGDGYLNLSSLASSEPYIKFSSYGTTQAHIWLKSILGNDGESSALLSFQIISILSGLTFIIATSTLARKLFENRLDSLLFTLGMISSGYMLMFFGYVEYYSLFVLSLLIYTIVGLLIINGNVKKWIILPLFFIPSFFHVLGITLIPSFLFILFSDTKPCQAILKLKTKTKWLLSLISFLAMIITFFYFYFESYQFRFAVVPIISDRFTVEGYTLFSFNHFVDFFNLLILLLPGLPLFLLILAYYSKNQIYKQKAFRFLLVLLLSTLGAVFIIDPKLGMPRDWDLLSFSGIPLAVLAYYTILSNQQIPSRYTVVTLLIILGFCSLIPRAVRQHTPDFAIAEFRSYADLDPTKNRAGRVNLFDFYNNTGDSAQANLEYLQWSKDFSENYVLLVVDSLAKANKRQQAIQYARWAIEKNPMFSFSYFALGRQYLQLHKTDSAIHYFEIAIAMNSHVPLFMNALGFIYTEIGEYKKAEQILNKSIKLDDKYVGPYLDLLHVYARSDQDKKYDSLLSQVAKRSDADPEMLAKLATLLINNGEIECAHKCILVAVAKGLDSLVLGQLEKQFPELKAREHAP